MAAAHGPRALIVEERPFVALVISDVLREVGFESDYAFDTAEAEQLLERDSEVRLAIVEADVAGGLELAHRIARERPKLSLVVTVEESQRSPAGLPTNARLLKKPFASGELRALVGGLSLLEEA